MALRSKRIKAGLLIGGILALIAAGAVGSLMRPPLEPDQVVAARFGNVVWNHDLHARMKEIGNCQVCHHKERQGETRPRPCRECHKPLSNQDAVLTADLHLVSAPADPNGTGQPAADPPADDQAPPPMTAFHGKCVGCHKAMARGPVGCRDCHTQSFTGEHGRVTWNHRAHARQIDMGEPGGLAQNCVHCHHQDKDVTNEADYRSCDLCHKPAAAMGLDMATHTQEHEKLRHGECARCHTAFDPEDDARTCKDCHTGMDVDTKVTRPAIEQAIHQRCLECHNPTYAKKTDAMPVRCNDCHKPDPSAIADLGVGLMMWDHDRHTRFGQGMSCDKCHHTEPADQPHLACNKCHGTGLYENPSVAEALRKRCLGCHKERDNGLLDFAQIAGQGDKEQVDLYTYQGKDGKFTWNHRDHAVAWSFSCRNCHHGLLRKDGEFVEAEITGKPWQGQATEIQSCHNCHGDAGPVAGSPAAGTDAPSYDGALQKVCLECHQKLGAGPQAWADFFAVEPVERAAATPAADAPAAGKEVAP